MIKLETDIAPILAEQYADLLSLDYRGRSTLLNSFHHNFDHLLVWDHRMQAYVEGLQRLDKTVHGILGAAYIFPQSRGCICSEYFCSSYRASRLTGRLFTFDSGVTCITAGYRAVF